MVRSLAKRVLERDLSIRAGAKVERANAVAQGGRGVAERADDSSSSAAQCTAAVRDCKNLLLLNHLINSGLSSRCLTCTRKHVL